MRPVRVPKPRFQKSRPARVNVATEIPKRGWQLPLVWFVTGRTRMGEVFERMTRRVKTYEEACAMADKMMASRRWDSVEMKSQELLARVKK